MIKTLRITGLAAVAFAGLVLASVLGFVSWVHLDDKNGERVSRILVADGAVERFQALHGDKGMPTQDKPPLVRQAELFKDIIDPKPVVQPTGVARITPPDNSQRVFRGPDNPTPKFTLLGTSCSASDPNSSFAYIRSPENTFKWVQCGDPVGHLTIKEVRENSVLCSDGTHESEVSMEVVPSRVSMMESDEGVVPSVDTPTPQPVPVKVSESPAIRPRTTPQPVLPPTLRGGASKLADDEREAVNELLEKVKRMQGPAGDANTATTAERRALADKLVSELRSSRVSPQETEKLEDMGDQVSQDKERAREEQKRELLKRLNPSRPPQN